MSIISTNENCTKYQLQFLDGAVASEPLVRADECSRRGEPVVWVRFGATAASGRSLAGWSGEWPRIRRPRDVALS